MEKEFYELYGSTPRPRDSESTRRAASLIGQLSPTSLILDVGCGKGKQTIDLAGAINGHIYAVDITISLFSINWLGGLYEPSGRPNHAC